MTCRCTCKAYGGDCDCRFDGKKQGAQQERERIVRWLRYHEWPGNIPFPGMLAEMIEQGAHEEGK